MCILPLLRSYSNPPPPLIRTRFLSYLWPTVVPKHMMLLLTQIQKVNGNAASGHVLTSFPNCISSCRHFIISCHRKSQQDLRCKTGCFERERLHSLITVNCDHYSTL